MGRRGSTGRRSRAVCLLGLVAAGLCGCGGSSSAPTTTVATTSPGATAEVTSGTALAGGLPGASGTTGTTPPTAAPTPARARFVLEADRVCLRTDNQLEAEQAKVDVAVKAEQAKSTAPHRRSLASAMHAETSLAKAELAQLRALRPPAADRAIVAAYLTVVASQVKLVDQFAQAVDDDYAAGVTTASAKLTLGETALDKLAGAYGFKVCGSTASPSS
jgi:hypothetical protein